MAIETGRYDAARDGDAAFALWNRTIGRAWPVDRHDFHAIVGRGWAAHDERGLVALAVVAQAGTVASLQLLLVEPRLRNRGIGSGLLATTVDALAAAGVNEVHLGRMPGPYFWPGLPPDLAGVRPFFELRGWEFGDPCWDLVRSLTDYETPPDVAQRSAGTNCRWATEADREALLTFEHTRFPQWLDSFAADEQPERSVIAVDDRGVVAGSLLASDVEDRLWRRILGDDSGSIGAVGVDERARGRGVGTAMLAFASEQLRDRGVANCHIGWTTLLSFYGRLGYRPWRQFEPATLRIA